MTKAELIKAVQKETGGNITAVAVTGVLEALGTVAIAELQKGNTVPLPGLGVMGVVDRAPRTGRNPQTGAVIQIEAKKAPKFTAGKALKDALN